MSDSLIVLVIAGVWLGVLAFAYCLASARAKPSPPPPSRLSRSNERPGTSPPEAP